MRNYKMLKYREQKGFTQQQLADEIDVTRQTINGIEKGNLNPTMDIMNRLVNVLGAERFDDLFDVTPWKKDGGDADGDK